VGRRTGGHLNVLVDTHCLVWWFASRARLSPTAAGAIQDADRILISPISWWEVGLLVRDGRVTLDRPLGLWINLVLEDRRSATAALSPEAAAWAGHLDRDAFPGDPADRLIYATARDLRVPLVSKDGRLHRHAGQAGDVDVVW
jgi:PIN domain nuclease of toxin-antitoxin system